MIATWVKEEMATANLGDARLDARLERIVSRMGQAPHLSIPAACRGRAEMEATYRFFDNPNVSFLKVLEPHGRATKQRIAAQSEVLLPQDTTEIDLTRPDSEVAGVGSLDGSRRGFLLHTMQAYTREGVALGTVWAEILNRTEPISPATRAEKQKQRKQTPIEQKESQRWLTGLRQARQLAQELPGTRCVCLADSEGDIDELFAEDRGEHPVDWVIRACQNRALEHEGESDSAESLRETVQATPVLYEVDLLIRGREAKTTVETRTRRQNRVTRTAHLEVRAATVTLRPPYRPDRVLEPIAVNVVLVREANPPAGEPRVEWILLTTLAIDTPEAVRGVVERYCIRWNLEVFFRTLKSGCRIEERRFEAVERVLPCLAVCPIVAWRTLFVCRMGSEFPDLDCEAVFEPSEWKAVWMTTQGEAPPATPPSLSVMVRLVASLGGFVDRPKSDPGAQTIWIGLQRMYDLAWGWDAFGPGKKKQI